MIARSIGKYRVLDRIGRGGMGTVYRAIDDALQREVAIKVLNAELTEPEALKRFRTEAITLARLHHPSIAMLFELHEENGELMMVMEFVRGETLQKLAERIGRMPPDFAAQLCAQALDGLSHAHRAGIIHRDLKPGNIMVTDDGLVKVMDFGIARIAGSEHLTSDGLTMGTPAYMAPEQVLGHEVDARSDLYAMGVVLYRLWTGQLPFDGDTPFVIVDKQLHEAPTPLNVACPDLPLWCDAIMARALAKDPADRFQTAQEFKAALASSATFVSIDDLATATMQTPRAVPLDTARNAGLGSPSAPVPLSASGQLGRLASSRVAMPADRPPTGPVTTPSGRTVVISARDMFAGVGAIVIVIVLLVIGGFIAMRRLQVKTATQVAATATPAAPIPPVSSAPSAPRPAETAPPPGLPAAPATRGTPPSSQAAEAANRKQSPEPSGASAQRAKAPTPADTSTLGVAAAGTAAGAVATPPTAPALPAVTFDKLKLIVMEGDKAHEEDASVKFSDGRIVISGQRGQVIASLPYSAVRCLSSARSRQPRWRGPDGRVAETKVPGGALGFMKSDRNWIGIATQKAAYVFRVDDGRVTSLGESAAQRTGVPVVRLSK